MCVPKKVQRLAIGKSEFCFLMSLFFSRSIYHLHRSTKITMTQLPQGLPRIQPSGHPFTKERSNNYTFFIWYQMVLLMDKNPAPVEVGSLSHYPQGFKNIPGGCLGFLNHRQYPHLGTFFLGGANQPKVVTSAASCWCKCHNPTVHQRKSREPRTSGFLLMNPYRIHGGLVYNIYIYIYYIYIST